MTGCKRVSASQQAREDWACLLTAATFAERNECLEEIIQTLDDWDGDDVRDDNGLYAVDVYREAFMGCVTASGEEFGEAVVDSIELSNGGAAALSAYKDYLDLVEEARDALTPTEPWAEHLPTEAETAIVLKEKQTNLQANLLCQSSPTDPKGAQLYNDIQTANTTLDNLIPFGNAVSLLETRLNDCGADFLGWENCYGDYPGGNHGCDSSARSQLNTLAFQGAVTALRQTEQNLSNELQTYVDNSIPDICLAPNGSLTNECRTAFERTFIWACDRQINLDDPALYTDYDPNADESVLVVPTCSDVEDAFIAAIVDEICSCTNNPSTFTVSCNSAQANLESELVEIDSDWGTDLLTRFEASGPCNGN